MAKKEGAPTLRKGQKLYTQDAVCTVIEVSRTGATVTVENDVNGWQQRVHASSIGKTWSTVKPKPAKKPAK